MTKINHILLNGIQIFRLKKNPPKDNTNNLEAE